MKNRITNHSFGFVRVAAVVPVLKLGDSKANIQEILNWVKKAEKSGASIVLFPELSITGYTLGDLHFQESNLFRAQAGLEKLISASKGFGSVFVVGVPLRIQGKVFNTAAVIGGGKLHGIVPKTYIPGYKEFYEERWFASARDLSVKEIDFLESKIPVGTDLLFRIKPSPEIIFGIEICEDLWVPVPPSSIQALRGANIILNPSASNEVVAKADYRRELVSQQSARTISAYVYSSCGVHESTTDLVFGGHAVIAENGKILAESKRFEREGEMVLADIDIEHLLHDRAKTTSFGEPSVEILSATYRYIDIPCKVSGSIDLLRNVDRHPFVPQDPSSRNRRVEEIFSIQSAGLAKRLESAGIKDTVIGVSGGLDSTLALLVAVKTFSLLGLPLKNIHAYTMPGFGTSRRTKSNAYRLCKALDFGIEEIDIRKGTEAHFKDIKHNPKSQDRTFENVQARYRTMILMNKANQLNAIVVGTGDLSELALGWNTFSGDQISHYNVNAGVPKTLVRYVVEWVAENQMDKAAIKVLRDVLSTPISPELVRNHKREITQKTEEIIGPYELHDFFLYHFVRWGSAPRKIFFLASISFKDKYSQKEILQWLKIFLQRFFSNQWKRSVMPDGPKVGSVALSPRGDWRVPSDIEVESWLEDLS